MITTPLRILLVEDCETDVLFIIRTIKKLVEVPQIEVVEGLTDCYDKMINFAPDVVISNYNLPTCNGLEILQIVQEVDPNLPFIFLTGTIQDEELAANTILAGTWGYILKKHMSDLEARLKPLLKRVVFNISEKDRIREQVRESRIAVNQIYNYLDNINRDNIEHKENIAKIKGDLSSFKLGEDDI